MCVTSPASAKANSSDDISFIEYITEEQLQHVADVYTRLYKHSTDYSYNDFRVSIGLACHSKDWKTFDRREIIDIKKWIYSKLKYGF